MPGATSMNCPTSARRYRRAALTGGAVLLVVAFGGCAGTASRLPVPPSPSAAAPAQWHAPRPHGGRAAPAGRMVAPLRRSDAVAAARRSTGGQPDDRPGRVTHRAGPGRPRRGRAPLWPVGRRDGCGAAVAARNWRFRSPPACPHGCRPRGKSICSAAAAPASKRRRRASAAPTAGWHAARVLVAAEVASSYTALRACEAQLPQSRADAASRAETARLTDLSTQSRIPGTRRRRAVAGERRPVAGADASLQASRCEREVKALVALTALAEPALRDRLRCRRRRRTGAPSAAGHFAVASVPAAALAQRPDCSPLPSRSVAALADVAQATPPATRASHSPARSAWRGSRPESAAPTGRSGTSARSASACRSSTPAAAVPTAAPPGRVTTRRCSSMRPRCAGRCARSRTPWWC